MGVILEETKGGSRTKILCYSSDAIYLEVYLQRPPPPRLLSLLLLLLYPLFLLL